MEIIEKRKCNKCKKQKDISEFHKNKNNKTGINLICKKCVSNYDRQNGLKKSIKKFNCRNNKNLSIDQYNTMVKEQDGKCFICKRKPNRRLDIDHCHTTGKIRRLLCRRCNLNLGYFKDDKMYLLRAFSYLENN